MWSLRFFAQGGSPRRTLGSCRAGYARPCRRRDSPSPLEALFLAFAAGGGEHGSGFSLLCLRAGAAAAHGTHALGDGGNLHSRRMGGALCLPPVLQMAPRAAGARSVAGGLWRHCGPFSFLPLRRLAWISLLIYVGAATHVFWDGLTHEDGWALRDAPPVGTVMVTIAGQPLHWMGLLQYGSSALGLGLVAWWSWQWYRRAPRIGSPRKRPSCGGHVRQSRRP